MMLNVKSDPYKVELVARLTDSDGNPLPGKQIDFYYRLSGTGTWTYVGNSTTDDNGNATCTLSLGSGYYDFKAEFPGDNDYSPSSATIYNYAVGKPTTTKPTTTKRERIPLWIIIVIIVLVLLVLMSGRS